MVVCADTILTNRDICRRCVNASRQKRFTRHCKPPTRSSQVCDDRVRIRSSSHLLCVFIHRASLNHVFSWQTLHCTTSGSNFDAIASSSARALHAPNARIQSLAIASERSTRAYRVHVTAARRGFPHRVFAQRAPCFRARVVGKTRRAGAPGAANWHTGPHRRARTVIRTCQKCRCCKQNRIKSPAKQVGEFENARAELSASASVR